MAETGAVTHLWDRDHSEEGRQTVSENESLHDALMDHISQMCNEMKLSDAFWNLLIQRGVANKRVKTKIQAAKTKRTQAMALVQHVLGQEVYKLHGFVWALVNSNQCRMVELLRFPVDDYLDIEVFKMSSSFCCPACSEFFSKAYIMTGCGHYICAPCVKGARFLCKENEKEDVTCPVPDCGKTTEASPSEESLGLDEDVAFKDLCDLFLKGLSEKRENAKKVKDEKVKDEDDEVKVALEKLKEKAANLEKFRNYISQQEATLKDHVREEKDKIIRFADNWELKNLKAYAGIEHQVHKKLHQSLQWEKAASELSIFLRTLPWLPKDTQTMRALLKKEADSPIPTATLMKKLDSGASLLSIVTPYNLKETSSDIEPAGADESVPMDLPDAGPAPPTKVALLAESRRAATKLAFTPGGEVIVLNSVGLHQGLRPGSLTVYISSKSTDMGISANGTQVQTPFFFNPGINESYIQVKHCKYIGTSDIPLSNVTRPHRIFINSSNIFVLGEGSRRVFKFNLKYQFEGFYDVGPSMLGPITGYIHVTERGLLLVSSPDENRIYMVDLDTKKCFYFIHTGGKPGRLKSPQGICSMNGGEHILVCDTGNNRVCVFSHDGRYLNDLVIDDTLIEPNCLAVLARRGQPTQLALGGKTNLTLRDKIYCVGVTRLYSLQ